MERLDTAVTDTFIDRVLQPQHLTTLLSQLNADAAQTKAQDATERHSIESRFKEADLRVTRLFDAIENGLVTDGDTFRSRLAQAQAERQEALRLLTESQRRATEAETLLSPKKIAAFSKGMADLLRIRRHSVPQSVAAGVYQQGRYGKQQCANEWFNRCVECCIGNGTAADKGGSAQFGPRMAHPKRFELLAF